MKFHDILMVIDNSTMIRAIVTIFGMEFKAEHYANYFLSCTPDELLNKRVTDMRIAEKNVLEVALEK